MALFVDLDQGESLKFTKGEGPVSIVFEGKRGRKARLKVEADKAIPIEHKAVTESHQRPLARPPRS